nr:EOG090X09CU [Cyclestheria hislopi]
MNLVWAKAQKRLVESKLKSLLSELKVQDKEELQLKRLKADGLDKDGLKEAELRKKLGNILERYGLNDHFDEEVGDKNTDPDNSLSQNLFKDKKLNKLWMKAETAGFTEEELKTLKEEFIHHQDKVDTFYNILEKQNAKKIRENDPTMNEVHIEQLQDLEEKDPSNIDNSVENARLQHRDIKSSYDRLERMTLSGPKSKDFEEPKVQGLWRIAQKADFTTDELESLRIELRHYEQRLLKLRHLQAQQMLKKDIAEINVDRSEEVIEIEKRLKLQERKVQKLHADLETRITQRHLEL